MAVPVVLDVAICIKFLPGLERQDETFLVEVVALVLLIVLPPHSRALEVLHIRAVLLAQSIAFEEGRRKVLLEAPRSPLGDRSESGLAVVRVADEVGLTGPTHNTDWDVAVLVADGSGKGNICVRHPELGAVIAKAETAPSVALRGVDFGIGDGNKRQDGENENLSMVKTGTCIRLR